MSADGTCIQLQSGGQGVADRCVFSEAKDPSNLFVGGIGPSSLSIYYDCQFTGSYGIVGGSAITAKFYGCTIAHNLTIGANVTFVWAGGEIGTGGGTIAVSGSATVNIDAQITAALTISGTGTHNHVIANTGGLGGAVTVTSTLSNVTVTGVWAAVSFSGAHTTQWVFDGTCSDLDFTGPGQINTTISAGSAPHRAVLRGTSVSGVISAENYTVPALKYVACSHSTIIANVVDIGAGSQAYTFDASSKNNLLVLGGSHQAGFTTAPVDLGANNRVITELDDTIITTLIGSGVLRGTDGRDGEDGLDGFPGPPGAIGPIGPAGPAGTGSSGSGGGGAPGADGDDGMDGFPGPQGAVGPTGARGAQGTPVDGIDGEDGLDGFPGPQGAVGPTGARGAQGTPVDGIDGEDGMDGFPGPQGAVGPIGPKGPQGNPGMDGLDGDDGIEGRPGKDGAAGLSATTAFVAETTWTTQTTGTGAAYIDIANATLSFPVIAGHRYRYSLHLDGFAGTAGWSIQVRCTDGAGTIQGDTPFGPLVEFGSGRFRDLSTENTELAAVTGTITRKWQMSTAVGTGNTHADATNIARFLVEDMTGVPGTTGQQGIAGEDGIGEDGMDGFPGPQGAVGPIGPKGPQGNPGMDGLDGDDGADGERGPAGPGIDVQVFTTAGANTWVKPAGVRAQSMTRVILIGGGGGGGSGASGNIGGGGAGGGGGLIAFDIATTQLGASLGVTVGAGGTGGIAVVSAGANGNPGIAGGTTQFSVLTGVAVPGGSPGAGGISGAAAGGAGGVPTVGLTATALPGGAGGAGSNVGAGANGQAGGGGAGGGGGGGVPAGAGAAGGAGQNSGPAAGLIGGGTAGTAGGGAGAPGNGGAGSPTSAGAAITGEFGGAGGGGGSGGNATHVGATGGAGGFPGGGGGGGGAATTSITSGAGGLGGVGAAFFITTL